MIAICAYKKCYFEKANNVQRVISNFLNFFALNQLIQLVIVNCKLYF